MAGTRNSGQGRTRSEPFQRYPKGKLNNPDNSLRWYDFRRQARILRFKINRSLVLQKNLEGERSTKLVLILHF
jgi:hypothetical protein